MGRLQFDCQGGGDIGSGAGTAVKNELPVGGQVEANATVVSVDGRTVISDRFPSKSIFCERIQMFLPSHDRTSERPTGMVLPGVFFR